MDIQVGVIPEGFMSLLTMLRKQEGGYIHKNNNEHHYTNGYGIYRHVHEQALIFRYHDELISKMTTINKVDSDLGRNWNQANSQELNSMIQQDKELWLSYLFYKDYFAILEFDKVNPILVRPIASIWTNGTKLCIRALQTALRMIYIKHNLAYDFPKNLQSDGNFGPVTKHWYMKLASYDNMINQEFVYLFLLAAKSEYIHLALNRSDLLQYLKGWDNRVNSLI